MSRRPHLERDLTLGFKRYRTGGFKRSRDLASRDREERQERQERQERKRRCQADGGGRLNSEPVGSM